LATAVKQITGFNGTGNCGTEGGFYRNGDIPTIICEPGLIAQAQKSDEWFAGSELEACGCFIRRLTEWLLA
jgi:acetylornithine deacetylase